MNPVAPSRLPAAGRVLAPLLMLGALAIGTTASHAADLRGFASLGLNGLILFQPCEGKTLSARTLKVEDATPDTALSAGIDDVRKIMLESGRPLYVEFRGDDCGPCRHRAAISARAGHCRILRDCAHRHRGRGSSLGLWRRADLAFRVDYQRWAIRAAGAEGRCVFQQQRSLRRRRPKAA